MSRDPGLAVQKSNSIYLRLIIPLGITLLAAMLAAWAIAVQLLTETINRRLDDQLDNTTSILAQGEFPFSPDLLDRLEQLIEARIALLDVAGDPGMSTDKDAGSEALAMLATRIDAFRGQALTLLTVDAADSSWRIAVRPIARERDSRFEFVAAAASLAPTQDAARNAAALLGAAMLFATVLLAWFAHYFARGITGPVIELATMANRIAAGERNIASEYDANNEIGLLARALNGMTHRLADYEDELARQSHLAGLGDLAARMAHEVRNPLTALKMHLQLLEESVPASERERVATLLDEIRRMELIVAAALTLGAPLVLKPGDVNVGDMVNDLAGLLRPDLQHRGIDLQTHTDHSPVIHADADRLRQVLLNLINNAAEEIGSDGIIRITTSTAGEGAGTDISVEDSGGGIPQDGAPAAAKKPFGLGIGLKICHEIVALHGGALLEGSSAALGGAQFTIRLQKSIIDTPEKAN